MSTSSKEVVIRMATYDFDLPTQHEYLLLDGDPQMIKLRAPSLSRETTFELVGVSTQPDEVIYELGSVVTDGPDGPYPVPAIQDEIQRLIDAYVALGGKHTDVIAWANGSGYREHLAFLRKKIRDKRG